MFTMKMEIDEGESICGLADERGGGGGNFVRLLGLFTVKMVDDVGIPKTLV